MINLRLLARDKACQIRLPGICNFDPATTVLAHYRLMGISGMGMKSPDPLGAHSCSSCHSFVDSHHDDATKVAFLEGVLRTQAVLMRDGIIKW